jgi:hypothetical protein
MKQQCTRLLVLCEHHCCAIIMPPLYLAFLPALQCRWRALSVAVLMALLTAGYISAAAAAFRNQHKYPARHEQACVLLEVASVFVTFWWLSMLRPAELLPQQTPFSSFVFRGYLLLLDQASAAAVAICIDRQHY